MKAKRGAPKDTQKVKLGVLRKVVVPLKLTSLQGLESPSGYFLLAIGRGL